MTNGGLAARLDRLEARRRAVASVPPYLICCLYHTSEPPGDVVGALGTRGGTVEREPGEALDAFTKRASAALGERVIFALYADEA